VKLDLSPYVRIFILSVLMLASELFLIRWISTEIRIFAGGENGRCAMDACLSPIHYCSCSALVVLLHEQTRWQ